MDLDRAHGARTEASPSWQQAQAALDHAGARNLTKRHPRKYQGAMAVDDMAQLVQVEITESARCCEEDIGIPFRRLREQSPTVMSTRRIPRRRERPDQSVGTSDPESMAEDPAGLGSRSLE
jgi:hypothetical protein